VARRVSPVERIRAEIDQLFSSDHDLASILEEVARLSVRLVLQIALEAEVVEFLAGPGTSVAATATGRAAATATSHR
jgi:hypothetical protein